MKRIIYLIPYSFFQRCEGTVISEWIARSKYAFALIETVHIMALAILLGTLIVVSLSLFGVGRRHLSPRELSVALRPWTLTCVVIMIATGIPMFMSEATRLSRSAPFYYKMLLLVIALAVQLTVQRKVTGSNEAAPWLCKTAACLSLGSWLGVALAGRAIAFF
jgi:hypothetical protein